MPTLYEINPDGSRGNEIDSGGCWGFMGREDDWEPFNSYPAKYARDTSTEAIADPQRTDAYSHADAQGYLSWLVQDSPYRDAFISDAEQIMQTGDCVVNLGACNQALILGLSHLRRIDHYGYGIWNQIPKGIPDGVKAILVQILHPYHTSTEAQLGAYLGDETSTSYRNFDAPCLVEWIKGTEINDESFDSLGQYELGFSGRYSARFNNSFSDGCLKVLDLEQYKTSRNFKGLFFSGNIPVLSAPIPDVCNDIMKQIAQLCQTEEQSKIILGDYVIK